MAAGTVDRQDPLADQTITQGQPVTLWVSTGRAPKVSVGTQGTEKGPSQDGSAGTVPPGVAGAVAGKARLRLAGESSFGLDVAAGDVVSATLTLSNEGNAPARNVWIVVASTNLQVSGFGGRCFSVPCALSAGQSLTFVGKAAVIANGPFSLRATGSAGVPQALLFQGTARGGGLNWLWVAVGCGVVLAGVAGIAANRGVQRRRWLSRVRVKCGLDGDDVDAVCGPMRFRAPAIGLICEVLPEIETRISVVKNVWTEKSHG